MGADMQPSMHELSQLVRVQGSEHRYGLARVDLVAEGERWLLPVWRGVGADGRSASPHEGRGVAPFGGEFGRLELIGLNLN
jgi:hypothetical protein